jgi:hypothetical protein
MELKSRKEALRKVIATQLADQPTRRAALRRSGRHHTDALLVDLYAGMLARSTIASVFRHWFSASVFSFIGYPEDDTALVARDGSNVANPSSNPSHIRGKHLGDHSWHAHPWHVIV